MTIQNYINRDTESPIHKTPVSELLEAQELKDESFIHLVQYIKTVGDEHKYESMKLNAGVFKQKVYESVNNTFKQKYWYTHIPKHEDENQENKHSETSPYKEMINWLLEYNNQNYPVPEEVTLKDNNFVEHVNYDFTLLTRYFMSKDDDLQNQINEINGKIDDIEYWFNSSMTLTTTDSDGNITHVSVNHDKNDNTDYCQMKILDGNKISSSWEVPKSGNLVIYGWLDSSSALNNKSIPSCYCVIEGRINSSDSIENWEIISVQPVIPAKNITYVGFNIPVHEGLTIRARTGFTVGAKSGQYSNEQDGFDTLSNITPNGFKCQVFSKSEEGFTR